MSSRRRAADLVAEVKTHQETGAAKRRTNLKALLGTEEGTYQLVDAKVVPINRIERSPNQPRQTFDADTLHELADSIRARGILQPIRLRRHGEAYQIVAGERRYRAAQLAGLTEIPAIVVDQEEGQAYIDSLIENVQREDLNPLDRADALRQLRLNLGSVGWKDVGTAIGLSERSIFYLLNLRELPEEIRQDVRSGELTEKHGRALHRLRHTPELQREAYGRIIDQHLTGDEALHLVKAMRAAVFTHLATPPLPGADGSATAAEETGDEADPADDPAGALHDLLGAVTSVEGLAARRLTDSVRRRLARDLEQIERRLQLVRSRLSE